MAIGNLNPTPDQKLAQRLEEGLKQKQPKPSLVSPPSSPKSIPVKKNKVKKRTNVRKNERSTGQTNKRTTVRVNERTDDQPNSRTNVQPVKRTNERKKIRHAFDIFEDQLFSLKELQLNRQKSSGQKFSLGTLAQEALDLFLESERKKADE
ncbi:MAG: hypothetical protein KDJ97_12260 [Anaerolineae bacterium]|nr:hypothetical protein [Anaerolineae bacterium]